MKYNGFYFWLFSSTMKKVLTENYDAQYAKEIMRKSTPLYRSLVQNAEDIGDDNPMAFNELFALSFVAPYLASEKGEQFCLPLKINKAFTITQLTFSHSCAIIEPYKRSERNRSFSCLLKHSNQSSSLSSGMISQNAAGGRRRRSSI